MQHTTSITTPHPSADTATVPDGPASLADPRPAYARAVHLAAEVVAAVRPDQLDDPTPCDGLVVRELIRHLHMTMRRAAAVTGTAGTDVAVLPSEDHTIGDDEWDTAMASARADALAAWSDDALLPTVLTLPWMQAEGSHVLAIYLNETLVHTWDLAVATGQTPAWRDDDVELADAAIRRELPDADRTAMWEAVRRSMPPEALAGQPWSAPFENAVAITGDAAPIERLVAWQGRDPSAA